MVQTSKKYLATLAVVGTAGLLGACATSGTASPALADNSTAQKMMCQAEASARCGNDTVRTHTKAMRDDFRNLETTRALPTTYDRAVPPK